MSKEGERSGKPPPEPRPSAWKHNAVANTEYFHGLRLQRAEDEAERRVQAKRDREHLEAMRALALKERELQVASSLGRTRMPTYENMKHAVAKALVDMARDPTLNDLPLTVAEVAQRSGVHIGHVREIMRGFRLSFALGDQFGWTRQQFDAVEAYALNPVPEGVPVMNSQTFNIGANHGQVIAGDNHGDMMISITNQLEQLVETIDKSDLPPEKKAEAKSKLASLATTVGIEGLKAAISGVVKSVIGG